MPSVTRWSKSAASGSAAGSIPPAASWAAASCSGIPQSASPKCRESVATPAA